MLTSIEIRQKFLDFFSEAGHQVVASASLVPIDDDSLLFTNAGMVPFKDIFLGKKQAVSRKVASVQRCVRAGGKHNDLENVGYTARHHTFFEMLGNFSFGDYFKQEAIRLSWHFLTQVMGLPQERLWVTVYEKDEEAAEIWLRDIGIDPKRISRIGAKDNFWQMGDTGPCGPCTEIFYDHGDTIYGGPPGSKEEDGDRYVEIWNLVFMQYNRNKDGNLTALPAPSVDTGMGLERLVAILQGKHSNYEIDLFQALIAAARAATHCPEKDNSSLRVIADHIRSCAFLIADGILPSNEGRGYVLRRIIRRACRHGYQLGQSEPFFYTLVDALVEQMGQAYPELYQAKANVEQVLKVEEEKFSSTLSQGITLLNTAIKDLKGTSIPGEVVFQLYDTYGFPVDLTADIAREHGFDIDEAGYRECMDGQRARARLSHRFNLDLSESVHFAGKSKFVGYTSLAQEGIVTDIVCDGEQVASIVDDQRKTTMIVLDNTPFYAEAGGQIGDVGELYSEHARFCVTDTQKHGDSIVHQGYLRSGRIKVGDGLQARVASEKRLAIQLNHSATHLMHWALRKVLGPDVQQKGSLVNDKRLRFDFSHSERISETQLLEIEQWVNAEIRKNLPTQIELMDVEAAKQAGAVALFGEKYGDVVRVLTIGEHSIELCGGTHVSHSGDIGLFKIVAETGIAAGVRRIEAVTGQAALDWVNTNQHHLSRVAIALKTDQDKVEEKIRQIVEKNHRLEHELQHLKAKMAAQEGDNMIDQAVHIQGVAVLSAKLEGADAKVLGSTLDRLKNKLGSAVIVLATVEGDKVNLIAGVTQAETHLIKAGELINYVAGQVGGKGGGRADMARAGGRDPAALEGALATVEGWVREKLVI